MKNDVDPSIQPFDTMYEAVCHWAERTPDAPALVDALRAPISYRKLRNAIDAIGADLNGVGIGRNDRVAIVHPGGRDMALTIVGVWSYATPVPLNPDLTLAEFTFQMREMRVCAVAITEDMDTSARRAAEILELPILGLAAGENDTVAFTSPRREIGSVPHLPGPAHRDDIVAVVSTSGTTSYSKVVPIRHPQIVCRNIIASRALELSPDDCCLNMLRLFHGGGLGQGLSTPLIAGSSIGVLTDFSVRGVFDAADALKPTWCTGAYTLFHSIHRNLAEYQGRIDGVSARLRFLRSGTGPLNPKIAEELEQAFGVPLIESYASSESGVVTSEPLPPECRKDGSVGPLLHDDVAILDDTGAPVIAGSQGEIAVRGPAVFDGYENDEAATRAAFVDGWYRTGDMGYVDADNYLFLTGRIKELINRGGQKISPNEIDDVLLAHPDILAGCAFPLPHSTLGEDVTAAVVRKAGSALTERSLSDFLRKSLAEYKIPRRIEFVDEIPKGPTGKVQRHTLAAAFGMVEKSEATAAADEDRPATPLESQLQAVWASALGLPHVGLHDEFFSLGGDSLQAIELFLQIEKVLGSQLPRSVLLEASTVAEMAQRIATTSPERCLVPIQPAGDRPAFFGIHDINGQVLNFRALAQHLGEDQPFYGLQLVGLDGAGAPLARIEDMAARYVSEIRRLQPAGPYYLGGYSMGGLVAYEMARQLQAARQDIGLLALFDTHPRHAHQSLSLSACFEQDGNRLSGSRESSGARSLGRGFRTGVLNARTTLERCLFGAAWRLCESCGVRIPKYLHRPVAANILAVRSYRMRPYDGDAVLFRASPYAWERGNVHDAWRDIIRGDLEIHPISGLHHEILKEPHIVDLARKLSDCLSARQKGKTQSRPVSADNDVETAPAPRSNYADAL